MVRTLASDIATANDGLRPIDLRRDLRAIAALIADAFADELDSAGLASLREMQTVARLGPLLYLFVPPSGELGSFFRGFVWEADGEIVGNITIQQADSYGSRWMIANVAVRPDYRGHGIARQLLNAALERIRQLGGEWAMLQVREENDVARGLYQQLGFGEVIGEITLRHFSVPQPDALPLPDEGDLRPISGTYRSDVRNLIQQRLPELARWRHPGRKKSFEQNSDPALLRRWGHLLGLNHRLRLGLFLRNGLGGILDVDTRPRTEHNIDILLHPDVAERWAKPLFAHGLQHLSRYPHQPVTATLFDYQPEAVDALKSFGFRPTFTLVTMRKRIR